MTAIAQRLNSPGRGWASGVVMAGLAGGAVDAAYATTLGVIRSGDAGRPWLGVASGWLGKAAAAKGGAAMVALGLVTHCGIAFCMAGAYALVASRLAVLYRRPALCGVVYGLLLYLVMYRIVLPLRFPQIFPRWDGMLSLADIATHVGVGLAIALVLSQLIGRTRPKH